MALAQSSAHTLCSSHPCHVILPTPRVGLTIFVVSTHTYCCIRPHLLTHQVPANEEELLQLTLAPPPLDAAMEDLQLAGSGGWLLTLEALSIYLLTVCR